MNLYYLALMDKPSIEYPWCAFCGKPATNRHHIVFRSQGGTDGPTVTVCGFGNASGCHGKLHNHLLHLRFTDRWEYLETDEPTKYEKALSMEGWKPVRGWYE